MQSICTAHRPPARSSHSGAVGLDLLHRLYAAAGRRVDCLIAYLRIRKRTRCVTPSQFATRSPPRNHPL